MPHPLHILSSIPLQGRGTPTNPASRFERLDIAPDFDHLAADEDPLTPRPIPTEYLIDHTKSIIAYNDSPDVSFDASINPYRGCEHGCIYCFARPTHEYLDMSAGLDFESKILVKIVAPKLLRKELSSKSYQPQSLGFSGVTDPYQPIERKLELTRRCLEVLLEFRNPVAMITKSALIARDADLLSELAKFDAAMACISITTLDNSLASKMEPRAAAPAARLSAMKTLADAGVPVGVLVAPVVPAINDHEILPILQAAADHGATFAGYVSLRLPFGIKDLFADWLTRHFSDRKDKVLHRVQDLRGGKLNDANFFSRMKGQGPFADYISDLFTLGCRKAKLNERRIKLSAENFRQHGAESLFG